MSNSNPRNILIRAPNWVGDIVMATSSFADVRRAFPEARVSILLKAGREKVIDGSPDFDRILFDRAGNSPAKMWRLARELTLPGSPSAVARGAAASRSYWRA